MPDITAEGGGLVVVAVVLILREVRSFVSGMGANSPETMRSRVLNELEFIEKKVDRVEQIVNELLREIRSRPPGA